MKSYEALALLGAICLCLAGCPEDKETTGDDGGTAGVGSFAGTDGGNAGTGSNAGTSGGNAGSDGSTAGTGSSTAGTGSSTAGTGSSNAGTGGGEGSCAMVASENARLTSELGCEPDNALVNNCNMLYANDFCTSEWEALVDCLEFEAENFFCDYEDHDGRLQPKDSVCTSERAALDSCTSG
jgi:hypothetical protein